MSGSDVLGLSGLYEDISDTELANVDLDDNPAGDVPSYAAVAVRDTGGDWSNSGPDVNEQESMFRPSRIAVRIAVSSACCLILNVRTFTR